MPSGDELARVASPAVKGKWARGLVVGIRVAGKTRVQGFGRFAKHPDPGKIVFEIGSVTKTFTGLLLADAVVRGKAKLTDPVKKYVDFAIPSHKGKDIRLVDLATHSSGLPPMPTNFVIKDQKNPYKDYTQRDLVAFLAAHKLACAPGENFAYSNLGMGLLGNVISPKINHTDFETDIINRIARPLGMVETRIKLTPSMKRRLAAGHDSRLAPSPPWDIPALPGAGALRSTADDMLKYLAAQLEPEKTPLAAAIALSQKRHFKTGEKGGCGLGWLIGSDKLGRILDHAGQTGAYASYVSIDPRRKLGVVVLSDTASPAAMGTGFALMHRLRSGSFRPSPLPVAVDLPADRLRKCVGRFRFDETGAIEVTYDRKQLYMRREEGGPKLRLDPVSKTRFFVRDLPTLPVYFEFVTDDAGHVTAVIADPDGAKTKARRAESTGPKKR